MKVSDYSFHDATILEVKELPENQVLEFLLDFPVDWENNRFEHRILRFNDVISYSISLIPFIGNPTILEIKECEIDKNAFTYGINKIEINTNAGNRIIEYTSCELIELTNH